MSKEINFPIGKYELSTTKEELDKAYANTKLSTENLEKLYKNNKLVNFLGLATNAELKVLENYVELDDLIGIRINIMNSIVNEIASRQGNVSSKKRTK